MEFEFHLNFFKELEFKKKKIYIYIYIFSIRYNLIVQKSSFKLKFDF